MDKYKEQYTAYYLANAMLTIQSTVHNPNVDKKNKMTKEDIIKMFIPVLKSDISREEFENIYDNIANVFFYFFIFKRKN